MGKIQDSVNQALGATTISANIVDRTALENTKETAVNLANETYEAETKANQGEIDAATKDVDFARNYNRSLIKPHVEARLAYRDYKGDKRLKEYKDLREDYEKILRDKLGATKLLRAKKAALANVQGLVRLRQASLTEWKDRVTMLANAGGIVGKLKAAKEAANPPVLGGRK